MPAEITAVHPVLMARDVTVSLEFYARLGFSVTFRDDPTAPRYAVTRRGAVELHLQWADPGQWEHRGDRPAYRFPTPDVDALHAELVAAGAIVARPDESPYAAPRETPWGTRELHLRDPGENSLQFYGPRTAMGSRDPAPRLTSFAPQLLVDDLARAIAFYEKLGFTFGDPWGGFYAIGVLDGLEVHLKEAAKSEAERRHRRAHEHLDAAAGVDGIEAFYARCVANGVTVLRPPSTTAWGTKDFYVEDPDGNLVAFGGRPDDVDLPPARST